MASRRSRRRHANRSSNNESAAQTDISDVMSACGHALAQHMDKATRAAWRLVNKQACQDIERSTVCLSGGLGHAFSHSRHRQPDIPEALPHHLLRKCPGVTTLSIRGSRLSSIQGLPPKLLDFHLAQNHTPLDWSPLVLCTALRSLALEGNVARSSSPAARPRLVTAIQSLPTLQRLHLTGNGLLSQGGATALAQALLALTRLQDLKLRSETGGPHDILTLAPPIAALSALTSLTLRGDKFGPAGCRALAGTLSGLGTLRSLKIGDSHGGPQGAAALAPAVSALTSLQELSMPFNAWGPAGTAALSPSIGSLTQLTKLSLQGALMGPVGAEALSCILPRLALVQSLNLSINQLSPVGGRHLAGPLGKLATLVELDLSKNALSSQGAMEVTVQLLPLRNLTALDLQDNSLGAEGLAELAPLFRQLTSVTALGVNTLAYCLDEGSSDEGSDDGSDVNQAGHGLHAQLSDDPSEDWEVEEEEWGLSSNEEDDDD